MGFKVSKFMLNIFEYPLVDQRSRDFKNLLKKSTLLSSINGSRYIFLRLAAKKT